jgi:hypothetical protein
MNKRNFTFHRIPTQMPFQAVFMRGGTGPACMDDLVVDQWTSDGESGSYRHFLFRQDVWTMSRHQISEKISSTISMAWYFTTKSGGIWKRLSHFQGLEYRRSRVTKPFFCARQREPRQARRLCVRHGAIAHTEGHVGLSLRHQHASPCQRGPGSCCSLGNMQRTASLPPPLEVRLHQRHATPWPPHRGDGESLSQPLGCWSQR